MNESLWTGSTRKAREQEEKRRIKNINTSYRNEMESNSFMEFLNELLPSVPLFFTILHSKHNCNAREIRGISKIYMKSQTKLLFREV